MADNDVIWVPTLPSMRDFGAALAKGAAGAGTKVGQQVGKEIGDGISQSRAAVEKATDVLAKAQDKVADAAGKVRVAEAQLQALRDRGVTDAGRLAAATEKVEAARRAEVAANRKAVRAADDLASAEQRVKNASDNAGEAASRTGGRFKSWFSGMDEGTQKLAGFAAAATGVGGAMALATKAMENEQGLSVLTAQLDLTKDESAKAGQIAGRLYSQNYGDSMSQVNDAVGAVHASLANLTDASSEEVSALTAHALDLSNAFGIDVAESTNTAALLIRNGLAKDGVEAFDLLTTAMQRVPVQMRDELIPIVDEYGGYLTGLGFTGQEAMGLLVNASQNGAIGLDKAGDALKEFGIRATDMSKASGEAYTAIKLDQREMTNALLKGGPEAQTAFDKIVAGLEGIKDPADRSAAALALFGTPLEDIGVTQMDGFLSGLSSADGAMMDFAGSADQMGSTLADNSASKFEQFKRGLETAVVGVLGNDAMPIFGEVTTALNENSGAMLGVMAATSSASTAWGVASGAWDKASKAGDWIGAKARAMASFVGTAASATASAASTAASWTGAQAKSAAGWAATQARAAGAFIATAASATVQAGITAGVWLAAQGRAAAGWVATQATAIGSQAAVAASAVAQSAVVAGTWVAQNARAAASFVAQRAVMLASAAATGTITAAQWLLNAAMNANPIGIVITALAALAAGLVLAYQKSETFRNIVQGAWQVIQDAASFAWNNVIKPVVDGMGSAFSTVGGIASGVASGIRGAFSGIVDILKAPLRVIGQLLSKLPDKIGPWEIPGVSTLKSWGSTLQNLRTGGTIAGRRSNGTLWGPGSGTSDSIFGVDAGGVPVVRVSDGEGVVKRSAMDAGGNRVVAALNAGWVPSAEFLHGMLPGLASGGLITTDQLTDFAKGVEGQPYVWGGVHWGDCSGAVSGLVNYAVGDDPWGSRGATGNFREWLAAKGAQPGIGPMGSLSIGWYNGGPYGGHTAATLPNGVNFEMGGGRGNGQYGGQAAGADDPSFTDHAHFPPEFFLGGDPNLDGTGIFGKGNAGAPGTSTGPALSTGTSSGTSVSIPSSSGAGLAGGTSDAGMTLGDHIGKTAADFATETAGSTLDFFGLGKLMDLPLLPASQNADVTPAEQGTPPDGDTPPEQRSGEGAPLISIQQLITQDMEEAAATLGREARRLIRSDALVGGWG